MPSVAASMIASLREKPSHEDVLTSKAVPATMYIGKCFRLHPFVLSDVLSLTGGADTVGLSISACEII